MNNNLYIIRTTYKGESKGYLNIDHDTLPFAFKSRSEAFKSVQKHINSQLIEGYERVSEMQIKKGSDVDKYYTFTITYEIEKLIIMD